MPEKVHVMKFPFIDHEVEILIEEKLLKYLKEISRDDLFEALNYIIKELSSNANKANLKRIHFRRKGLDINNKEHYSIGVKDFSKEINEKSELYFNLAKEMGFFVKIEMYIENNNLVINIIDNSPILPFEIERIREKFKRAYRFKTLDEVFKEGIDFTEGGGLGLIVVILMLRKIGLDEKVMKILTNNEKTHTRLEIPLSIVTSLESDIIAETIAKEIEDIPQFPPHILQLQKILGNPNSNFKDVSEIIQRDPALIADILKTANSVLYAMPNKVNTIEEAVKIMGFNGIRNLITVYTTKKILMNNYRLDIIENIMAHSAEVAFYSYEIARLYGIRKNIDEIYTGGILHDIGKIILNALRPDILDNIKTICREKGIPSYILEDLTNGYNHSIIGGKLSEKWGFSEILTSIIRYHHIPLDAKDEYIEPVSIVYLSDIIYYYKRQEVMFNDLNFRVKNMFNFSDKSDFDKLANSLISKFDKKLSNW
ncbi:MAG TPA: HDOD domain-containing protein [Spirochaetota bacterium]|nr:HDOD domain-containing protein [Spirochaetota bacterium]HOM37995.1 HDOD domain-containing protein [Spirochaetota bacterium]HPQ48799.1 HDOD domain-containing protein [Spirochaetota bacterium]